MNLICVFIGGGLGAVSRYGLSLAAARLAGPHYPWGTLAANLIGCLLIGALADLGARTALVPPQTRLFLVTGFLGGLTTFSTYALESVAAAQGGGGLSAGMVNLVAHNALGFALVVAGMRLARMLV